MIAETRRPTILHIDDDAEFRELFTEPLRRAGYETAGADTLAEAREILGRVFVDLLLVDERLGRDSGIEFLREVRNTAPGLGALVLSGHADYEMAARAMESGALGILSKPLSPAVLIEKACGALRNSELAREARYQRWYAAHETGFPEIVGRSAPILKVLESVRKAAPSIATVLIQGESGTGKELIARAIHGASPRRGQKFIGINLAAIPRELVESTLFGHRRGSFTGATLDAIGMFEAADRGTLFLDEIGEASPEAQVRLLRALEERTITRVGEHTARRVDVRLIAATNRDLVREVEEKRFREDLYYRLQVVVIEMPPLRERQEDIELLAVNMLSQQNRQQGKHIEGFEPAAMRKLRAYRWPGNVRELRNAIENAVIHEEGRLIGEDNLSLRRATRGAHEATAFLEGGYREAVREFNRLYFGRLLQRAVNNKTEAARLAGLDRTSLHDHLRKLEGPRENSADDEK